MRKVISAGIPGILIKKKRTPDLLEDPLVGGEVGRRNCDGRIIAATNQALLEKVERGKFREDLYYRLCGIEILLPPLRVRVEDIPLLTMHFLSKACVE